MTLLHVDAVEPFARRQQFAHRRVLAGRQRGKIWRQPQPLRDGDQIVVGKLLLRFSGS